jgi:hypothetical protein
MSKIHTISTTRSLQENSEINTINIHDLFVEYSTIYFNSLLHNSAVMVEWSSRMTSCAGICVLQNKLGQCTIRLSKPLLKYRSSMELKETLIHEMIHAYLFLTGGQTYSDYQNGGHGQAFLEKMYEINKNGGYQISVYHTFIKEVESYQQHVWRCEV